MMCLMMMICLRFDSEMPSHCHRNDDTMRALHVFFFSVRAFVGGKSGFTSASSSSSRAHKRHGEYHHHHHHSHARPPCIRCKRNAHRTAIREYRANTHTHRRRRRDALVCHAQEEMCARRRRAQSRITLTQTHTLEHSKSPFGVRGAS